ncbi:hypothetical protein [Agromyces sp. LHK192]|uniref:hypothetical protein n=1 Tax=Agromyces sp. LHK192 TaxID=2498704 RepID=UPI00196B9378|nr:hypothetical protein [Agromyces sp. LHK192]
MTAAAPAPAPDAAPRRRPVVLTVVLVLVYLNAGANVLIGLFVLLSRYDVTGDAVLAVSLVGAAIILFGLLELAAAGGVGRGSTLSRILLTIYVGVLALLNLTTILIADTWDWAASATLAVELAIIVVLWLPPVSAFMRDAATAARGTGGGTPAPPRSPRS